MNQKKDERETSDSTLAQAALSGDRAAFDRLYERHAPTVARRLRRILGRREDVEDVLQMTFLELHRSLGRYDPARPFGAWLHGISLRVTSTFLRTRRRKWWQTSRSDIDTFPGLAGGRSPEDNAAVDEAARRVWAELQELAPEKRIAFTLFEIEQRTIGEVAELMGTSPQTAWARVNSAKERIAKRLAKHGSDGGTS
jgi:RNA polymerase sigma factor (sigma-70 family)